MCFSYEFLLNLIFVSRKFILIALIVLFQKAESYKLKFWNWNFEGEIRSKVEDLLILSPNQTVTCVEDGSHPEYINSTTEVFLITRQTVLYWPGGIEKTFPCIRTFEISDSGLKSVTKFDLQPHKKMRKLFLHNNDLESLDGDLFDFNPEITYIDFSLNRFLTVVGEKLLVPLKNLKAAHFHKSECIDSPDNIFDPETVQRKLFETCGSFELMRKQMKHLRNLVKLQKSNLDTTTNFIFENRLKIRENLSENVGEKVIIVCQHEKDGCSVIGAQSLEIKFQNSTISRVEERGLMSNTSEVSQQILKESNNYTSLVVDNQIVFFLPLNLSLSFPSLISIHVTFSSLFEIDAEVFENMPNLNNLTLSNNKLTKIPISVFKPLKNLHILDLSFNKIEILYDNTFMGLWKLEVLKINDNKLHTIYDKAFNYLRNVNKLSLQLNVIKTLSATLIDSFANIEFLDLSENSCVFGKYPGDSLKVLRKQIKSSCQAFIDLNCDFKLNDDAIEPNENYTCNIRDLSVENHASNIINVVGDHLIEFTNENVTVLSIVNQTMKSVPKNIADFFMNLEEITIVRSKLQWLKRKDFRGLDNLRKLVIRNNNIVMRYDTFQPIPQLEHLDLSYNKIKLLLPGVFTVLTQLKYLDLSHNRIAELKAEVFPPLTEIEEAYFNNNVIQFIEDEIIERVDSALLLDFTKNFAFDMKFAMNEEKNETFSKLYRAEILKLNARWSNSTKEPSATDWVDHLPSDLD